MLAERVAKGLARVPSRPSPMLIRHRWNGNPSPICPMIILRRGYLSKTPLSTMRMPCVAVSTVKPQAARNSEGYCST